MKKNSARRIKEQSAEKPNCSLEPRALCISILNDIRLSLFKETRYLGDNDL